LPPSVTSVKFVVLFESYESKEVVVAFPAAKAYAGSVTLAAGLVSTTSFLWRVPSRASFILALAYAIVD